MRERATQEELDRLRGHLQSPPTFSVETDAGPVAFVTAWGLFSAKRLDGGSAMLLAELAALPPPSRVLDFGCGYGAIGLVLARRWPRAEVVLVDKDIEAVAAAQGNAERNRLANARILLSPGFRDVPGDAYDLIVSNLPAQAGNEALDGILLSAYDRLRPGGTLAVVTVLGLRRYIRRRLEAIFGNAHKAKQGPRHVVSDAIRTPEQVEHP